MTTALERISSVGAIPLPMAGSDQSADRGSLAWRTAFVSRYGCLNSAEVAEQSSSTARNRSALASRWVKEGKIFAIRHAGRTLFPEFQFQDGYPVRTVAEVIREFPVHSTGWELAFFFTEPNSFIGGRRPLELLRTNPAEVVELARAFAKPADAF